MTNRSRHASARILVMVFVLIVAQTVSSGAARAAAEPACGATLTRSVTLHHDLVGCTGAGLVVAADGIVIDLNRHRVTGDGTTPADQYDVGVVVARHRDVTITGGAISGFDAGVTVGGSSGGRISRMDASDNADFGIGLFDTSHTAITAVTTRRNHDYGVWVNGGEDNRLVQVTATDSEQGVNFDHTSGAVLTHSTLTRSDLVLIGDRNRIAGNLFTDANGCGSDCGGYPISLEAGSHNVISGNRVLRTARDGIRLSNFLPEIATAHNVVEGNTVIDAGYDGIAVATEGEVPVVDSTVRDNTVIHSGQDGIHVATPSTDVTGNRVVANGRYGINAVPGVHDGGRNHAIANRATPQCLNVTCR